MSDAMNDFGLFWNSSNGDRKYNASSMEEWLKPFFTTGVFQGECQVLASAGMTVTAGTGYCNVNGKPRRFRTVEDFVLEPADSRNPRIDTIVIERNETDRNIYRKVVKGAYSGATPYPTEPVRNDTIYQLVIAQIYVRAGVTAITQENITDTRMDDYLCGYVTGTVTQIDFTQIKQQFDSFFSQESADVQDEVQALRDFIQAMELQSQGELTQALALLQAQFDTWFADVKGQLSTDVAGHLQNEIDALKSIVDSFYMFNITTKDGRYINTKSGLRISGKDGLVRLSQYVRDTDDLKAWVDDNYRRK